MVSLDTAGVPQGGRYGDVRRFSSRAARYGIHVGWSRAREAFIVYTRRGRKFICQQLCVRPDGEPVPLGEAYLQVLRHLRDKFAKCTGSAINEWIRRQKREQTEATLHQMSSQRRDMAKDVMNEMWREKGYETRPLISIPTQAKGA